MPSNPTLPEDVLEQAAREFMREYHGQDVWPEIQDDDVLTPRANTLRALSAIAPLIIEWARKDQAEKDAQIVEGEVVRTSYSATRDRAAAIRTQFTPDESGTRVLRGVVQRSAVTNRYITPDETTGDECDGSYRCSAPTHEDGCFSTARNLTLQSEDEAGWEPS